jgi:UDP-N-acetylmuramate dehydrogenase
VARGDGAARVIADTALDALAADLACRLPGRVERDASSAPLTTYRLGGPLAVLVRPTSEAELVEVARALAGHAEVAVLVVGRGSNLLVADTGFDGVAIALGEGFDDLAIDTAAARVRAGSALALPVLARRAAHAGVGGLEFYVGIPGTVGGAVRMNAGGHGRETRDVIVQARIVDLDRAEIVERDRGALGLGYRCSNLGERDVVVAAELAGAPDAVAACEERVAEIVRWRREHQPGGSNAGSVFQNPPGDAAGRLIDACGCKGLRVGGAVVSGKHANFFVAEVGATATDVHDLVLRVRERVEEATGVQLEPELTMVGFP